MDQYVGAKRIGVFVSLLTACMSLLAGGAGPGEIPGDVVRRVCWASGVVDGLVG